MGGIGSGPQKSPATLIKEAKENDVKNLPKYFDRLAELALDGDREALCYLVDRHLGKPKATTEIDLPGAKQLGAGIMVEIFKAVAEERRRQLTEGNTVNTIKRGFETF